MGIMKACTKCIALCLFGTRISTASTDVVSRNKTAKWFALIFVVNDTDSQLSTEIIPTKVSQCLQAGFLDLYLVDYTECVSELLNPISTHFPRTTSLQRVCYKIYFNS